MNDSELNEDIQQYPIKPSIRQDASKLGRKMISKEEITAVIPTNNPQTDEMNNMRFIINKFLDLNVKVIVVEQTKDQYSYLFKFIESIMISRGLTAKALSHEIFVCKDDKFLKHKIVNWAIAHKVRTEYVWVNDPNFYLDFYETVKKLKIVHEHEIFLPYISINDVSQETTRELVSDKIKNLSDSKKLEKNNFYYSFIAEKSILSKSGTLLEENLEIKLHLENIKAKNVHVTMFDVDANYLYNGPKIEILPRLVFSNDEFEKDMAIIVCHFNWCKYINPSRNLNRFLRQMEMENVPVYGIELSINDKFETAGRENWINIKVGVQNICFQKEACINLVEKKVPKKYKKIAWIDPDLHFTNKNWYRETSEKLNTHKLVQMYSDGYGTDRYGRISRRHPSIMAMYGIVPMDYWFRHPGHPGGAWAAQREFWDNGGLYPYCIMGGGDTVFVYTLFDYTFSNDTYSALGLCGEEVFKPYVEWKERIKKYVTPKEITYVNNSFIHEWHGDSVNRNYNLRHNIVKTIDITKNVRLNEQGIVELFNIKKKSIYDGILGYFKGRDEDGLMGDMESFINFKNQLNEKN